MTIGKTTKSGVFVANDFRDNLVIDRYDPIFSTMKGSKIEKLRSENSEDAVTWNVFRSIRQIDPAHWFPDLFSRAFKNTIDHLPQLVQVSLWPTISPPPALRSFQKDEGDSEIDVLIEAEHLVWFIEAKYKNDVSESTTNNSTRDQILRNIDVGSWYAGVRDFYFALLILDELHSPVGVSLLGKYLKSKNDILLQLPHRPDGLPNLKGMGQLTWDALAEVLSSCFQTAKREDERYFAKQAADWLAKKGIAKTT